MSEPTACEHPMHATEHGEIVKLREEACHLRRELERATNRIDALLSGMVLMHSQKILFEREALWLKEHRDRVALAG